MATASITSNANTTNSSTSSMSSSDYKFTHGDIAILSQLFSPIAQMFLPRDLAALYTHLAKFSTTQLNAIYDNPHRKLGGTPTVLHMIYLRCHGTYSEAILMRPMMLPILRDRLGMNIRALARVPWHRTAAANNDNILETICESGTCVAELSMLIAPLHRHVGTHVDANDHKNTAMIGGSDYDNNNNGNGSLHYANNGSYPSLLFRLLVLRGNYATLTVAASPAVATTAHQDTNDYTNDSNNDANDGVITRLLRLGLDWSITDEQHRSFYDRLCDPIWIKSASHRYMMHEFAPLVAAHLRTIASIVYTCFIMNDPSRSHHTSAVVICGGIGSDLAAIVCDYIHTRIHPAHQSSVDLVASWSSSSSIMVPSVKDNNEDNSSSSNNSSSSHHMVDGHKRQRRALHDK